VELTTSVKTRGSRLTFSSSLLTLPWELIFPLWAVPDARQHGSHEASQAPVRTEEDRPASLLRSPQAAQGHSSDCPLGFGSWIVIFFTIGMGQMPPHICGISSAEKMRREHKICFVVQDTLLNPYVFYFSYPMGYCPEPCEELW